MYYFQRRGLEHNWILQVRLMLSFPRWLFWGLFNITNLYELPCVIVSHSWSKTQTKETIVYAYLQHLAKFHLDLPSPRYSKSTWVTYLWLYSRGGWNPNLEEPYLLKYSEYERKNFTKGKKRIYLHSVKVSTFDPSPISCYRKSSRMTKFNLLGVSGIEP